MPPNLERPRSSLARLRDSKTTTRLAYKRVVSCTRTHLSLDPKTDPPSSPLGTPEHVRVQKRRLNFEGRTMGNLRLPILSLALLTSLAGCHVEPAPPTVEDAKATWHTIAKQNHLTTVWGLVDLRKTDGQMTEVNGVKIYTFFYEAQVKHLTPLGNWKVGDIQTIKSNYGYQKTEKGWQGPEGVLYTK